MRAPKIPSMFRNVRTSPRQFKMRSPHYDQREAGWAERQAALDAQFDSGQAPPQRVKLRRGSSVAARKQAQKKRSTRILLIIMALLFILWNLESWMAK
jgi:hypothetical protein